MKNKKPVTLLVHVNILNRCRCGSLQRRRRAIGTRRRDLNTRCGDDGICKYACDDGRRTTGPRERY